MNITGVREVVGDEVKGKVAIEKELLEQAQAEQQAIAKTKKALAKTAAAPANEPGFTGASGDILQKALQAGSDETVKLIQDRPGQTGNAATDVGSVFG